MYNGTLSDGETFEHNGATFRFQSSWDDSGETPWDSEDGHGTVSDWRETSSKAPGELVLCTDGSKSRFYDFAEACRIARRDGWGFLPGRLETVDLGNGTCHAYVRSRGNGKLTEFVGMGATINDAVSNVYAVHKASMSARQYAAGAAMRDFDRLHAFCDDQWGYMCVTVTLVDDKGDDMPRDMSETLGGVETDAGEYIAECARELADEILARVSRAA